MNRWDEQHVAGWAKTNTEETIWKRFGKRLSLTRGRGQDGHLRGASRDSRSSMYKVYIDVIHMKRKDWDVVNTCAIHIHA
jgi:hypothetical protein